MRRVSECVAAGAIVLLLPACTSGGKLTVRPVPTGFVEGERSASFRVVEARAHFALGNVALAAEGFRRALREDPASVDALNGLAACYDRMGRFDVARSHYEQALALAPNDARLYANLATSLELQGKSAEAAALRTEAAIRFASAAPALPPTSSAAPVTPPSASVTIVLSEIKPAARSQNGPRLERTGLGEVMLRSSGNPSWTPLRQAALAMSSRQALSRQAESVRATQIMVLNGTHEPRLAARTRQRLHASGWTTVTTGVTADPLRASQILYPASRSEEARRLGQELGLPVRQRAWTGSRLVIQLGRDRLKPRSPA
jgi:tetratricopeptide (TPR) repeat protein